jgi:hypothetical protein
MANLTWNGNDARRMRAKQVSSLLDLVALAKAITANMKILIPAMAHMVLRNSTFGAHPFLTIVVHRGELSHYRNNKDILPRAQGRNKIGG